LIIKLPFTTYYSEQVYKVDTLLLTSIDKSKLKEDNFLKKFTIVAFIPLGNATVLTLMGELQ